MRFPSLHTIALRARQVLARFPVTLAVGVACAVCAIVASTSGADDVWYRMVFVAALGLPLSFALMLLAELRGWSWSRRLPAMLGGALVLVAFFFAWPGVDRKQDVIRYFQLSASLHLLVAFLPFVGRREDAAFWQYNRRLFLSFLRAVVFTGVLFVGLSIAIVALDKLFGLDVPGDSYLRLWFVLAFVGNTWIFLDGVPADIAALVADREYPKALGVFTQYILTPLVAVYLLILLAYLVKILVTGEWPSGWIGYLVTSVSVAGILGFLLVHQLRDDPGEGWIRTYRRWLFIALIPAALMLLVAFFKRIVPYGITELRYLGALLGVWLLVISLLFTLRREHGIRIIPLSLSLLLLVTLFGPLGATHRSVASQASRLEREVAAARATPSPRAITPAEVEASAALRFLIQHRAAPEITVAFGGDSIPGGVVLSDTLRFRHDSLARAIMTAASLDYARWAPRGAPRPALFSYRAREGEAMEISGFSWLVPVGMRDSMLIVGSDSIRVAFDSVALRLTVSPGGDSAIVFDFGPALDSLDSLFGAEGFHAEVPHGGMHIAASNGSRAGALLLGWIMGDHEEEGRSINGWHGQLLIGPVRDGEARP